MAAAVRIRLLGGFGVEVGDARVPDTAWRLRKAQALVKLLALRPERALHPERLQALLWPDRDAASAGNNLRQALYQARRALSAAGADGAAVLVSRGALVALGACVTVDVSAFEAAAAVAEASQRVTDLEAAVAAYTGELLPEDAFEPWSAGPRRALADRHVQLLTALAAALQEREGPAAAVEPLRRAVAADPLHEEAHRGLMRALAAAGRRTQALEHYATLRAVLERETGADPDAATRALYRELLTGGPSGAGTRLPRRDGARADGGAPGRIPWQATSFVGRERELAALQPVLAADRLVTLTGPGGVGKTRLALEAATRRAGAHPDGAWVAELAALPDSDALAQTVATALGLELLPGDAGPEALAHHLAGRDLLLVLDNCEHVGPAVAALARVLLRDCPGLRLLATSRAPLHVPGEVDWRVPSLRLADPGALPALDQLAGSDAVRLFCERAAAANARFRLSEDNAEAVAAVCWRVDGLPLAIELAAARVAALAPAQIGERLGDALAVLRGAGSGSGTPGLTRQQTLEATLDWSHDLLAPGERVLFRRLAVFAGGFGLDAAETVAGADVPGLASLVDQSLVLVDDAGPEYRYRLLEPIRQYAAAKLAAAAEGGQLADAHARAYAARAAVPGGAVDDLDPAQVDRLERDHDNLRAALAWTLHHDPGASAAFAAGVAGLWLLRLHLQEGARWLERALAAAPDPTAGRVAALGARQAIERRRPMDYDHADRLCEERVAISRHLGDHRGEVLALLDHVDGTMTRGYLDRAAALAAEAAEAAELAEDGLGPAMRAAAQERMGLVRACRHESGAALGHFEAALELAAAARASEERCSAVFSLAGLVPVVPPDGVRPTFGLEETVMHFRRVPPALSRAFVLGHVAQVHRIERRHGAARAVLEEALAIVRAHGDELGEGLLLLQLGTLERDAGDLAAAAGLLERGLELRRRHRDVRGVVVGLSGLGVVAGRTGDRERAEHLLAEPRRIVDARVDGPGKAGCCMALADVAHAAGDPAGALGWLREALRAFYDRANLPAHASWVHLMAAHDAFALGDRTATEHHLQQARAAFALTGDRIGPGCCAALERRATALLTPC